MNTSRRILAPSSVSTKPGKITAGATQTANEETCAHPREVFRRRTAGDQGLFVLWVFPLLKSLLPVVVAFLLPTTDTLDHRRVGNGTHRHGLFQEPMEELPAMA